MAVKAGEWEEISVGGEVFTFSTAGEAVEGKLIAVRDGNYNNHVYDIERSEDKKLITVFGTTILDSRMASVKVGNTVKIEYQGELKTKGGRMAKNYKVFVKAGV